MRRLKPTGYNWNSYYSDDINTDYDHLKMQTVSDMLSKLPHMMTAADIGANTGKYSQLLLQHVNSVISVESDLDCCEKINKKINRTNLNNQHWAVIFADITNPTPSTGWMGKERLSLLDRIQSDIIAALAVMHHIIIAKRIPIEEVIELFAVITKRYLIIEYVDMSDPKVDLLIQSHKESRKYEYGQFLNLLKENFNIIKQVPLTHSRSIFLCSKKLSN